MTPLDAGLRRKLLVAAVLVAAAAAVPILVAGAPADTIPVMSATQSQSDTLERPTAEAWNDAAVATLALSNAPSQVPNANQTSVERVNVQAARTERRLYVRLSWADATEDGNVTPSRYDAPRLNSYGDAVAVQLPANASQQPGIAMGSPQSMVNVWWWNGATERQEMLAAGPGSTTPFETPTVSANATYADGRWQVVFARNLSVERSNRVSLAADRDVTMSVAVWNGSNGERAGRKGVSEWYTLPFGPEPPGPPYETVLWTVAGLAIAVVVVITASAVRGGGS